MSFALISNWLVALCVAIYPNRKSIKPKEYRGDLKKNMQASEALHQPDTEQPYSSH